MKKKTRTKRFLAALLTLCLLLGLCACGGEETETEESAQTTEAQTDTSAQSTAQSADEEEYGYLATVQDLEALGDDENGYIFSAFEQDGEIYLLYESWDTETYVSTYYLIELDETGAEQNRVALDGYASDAYLQNYAMGGGYLWAVSYQYVMDTTDETDEAEETTDDWTSADPNESAETETETSDDWTQSGIDDDWTQTDLTDANSWGQETETTESAESEADTTEAAETEESTETEAAAEDTTEWIYEQDYEEEYQSGHEVYTLLQYDLQGQLISSKELTAPEELDYFYVGAFDVDTAGNIYLTCDTVLLCYDSELNLLGQVTVDTFFNGIYAMPDGSLLVYYCDEEYNDVFSYLDTETWTLGEPFSFQHASDNYGYNFCFGADGQLYATNSVGFYSVEIESGELTAATLLNWLDADVDRTNAEAILPESAESILMIGRDSVTNAYQLTTVNRVPASEIPVKTELTLGVEYLGYTIRQLVLSFNRSNPDYRITVRDYSEYNTDDDADAGMTRLMQDIATGDAPDLLYLSYNDMQSVEKRGALTDLYMLMDGDSVQKEDLTACYRNAMEQGGSLYSIAPGFQVQTILAGSDVVGSEPGWTLEEFYEIAQNYTGDGQVIFDYVTRDGFLTDMLGANYTAYIDEDTGTCSFDTAEFQALLEACMLLPEDYTAYDELYADGMNYFDVSWLLDGRGLAEMHSLYSADALRWMADYLTDDYTLIGYPGAGGSGGVLNVDYCFAVCAQSQYPDVAWDFIATTMTEEYAENNVYNFSTLQSYYDEQLASTTEAPYYYDENGEKVEYEDTILTQEQVDLVREIIEGTTAKYVYDEQIITIVTEEAAAYFSGQKSVEDVTALIQNRVQLYLDEQG